MDREARLALLFKRDRRLPDMDPGRPSQQTQMSADMSSGNEAMADAEAPPASISSVSHNASEAEEPAVKKPWHQRDSSIFESGERADPTAIEKGFCPLFALSRLPYKYLSGQNGRDIARVFFDSGQFWKQTWDLYYILPPRDVYEHPLTLVPAAQVEEFLQKIRKKFKCDLALPADPQHGLVLRFHEEAPQPQYLGRCSSSNDKERLVEECRRNAQNQVPPELSGLSEDSIQEYRKMLSFAVDASRRTSKAEKERKRKAKLQRQREWAHALRRGMCFFGLLPQRPTTTEGGQVQQTFTLRPLELNEPSPFDPAMEPIFICIDVESDERASRDAITEVGVSTLDTLDLVGVAPGERGRNWTEFIRSRHFRVKERRHIVNHRFVNGCPDMFDFGRSEWVSIKNIAKVVNSCFFPPYSADSTAPSNGLQQKGEIKEHKLRRRNIILVGHDVQSDIRYLRNLGCAVFQPGAVGGQSTHDGARKTTKPNQPTFVDTMDTNTLFQVLKREENHRALSVVLMGVGIVGWHLHNAGNDARYTLEAMVRMILASRLAMEGKTRPWESNSINWALKPMWPEPVLGPLAESFRQHEAAWKEEVQRRVNEANVEEIRVREDCGNWEIATGWSEPHHADDIDGGKPRGIVIRPSKKKKAG